MINQDAFLNTLYKLEVKGKDLELVLLTWLRCEDAMLKKSAQEPVLFTSNEIWFDEVNDPDFVTLELPRSDLQAFKSLLEFMLSETEVAKKELKKAAEYYWQYSDKNTEHGPDAFKHLNEVRNLQRQYKRKTNSLAKLQALIKKALNS